MDFKIGDIHKVSFNATDVGLKLADKYGAMPMFRIASKLLKKDKHNFIKVNPVKEDDLGLLVDSSKEIILPVNGDVNWM